MSQNKHTPGEMLIAGHTLYILNEDGSNRITANVQAGFVRQPRQRTASSEPTTKEEAKATAARLALCWNSHDKLVDALRAQQRVFNAVNSLKPMMASEIHGMMAEAESLREAALATLDQQK